MADRRRSAGRADLGIVAESRKPTERDIVTAWREPDLAVVAELLGREPAGAFTVVVRRPDGRPAVIENAPLLRDGRPMPTRYWLTDPDLRDGVSRLEAAGGVRRAEREVSGEALAEAHSCYAAERDCLVPSDHRGPAPSGGVGGTRRGVKCLHAHLAWFLAGGNDPAGQWTAAQLDVRREEFVVEGGAVPPNMGTVAALDCGTNSTRLLVATPGGNVLERHMHITRLGERVDATRHLAPSAIARTLDVLREYRRLMDAWGVAKARLVATSAVRDADNGRDFLGPAAEVTGVIPEVLTGAEEGRLSFEGAIGHLPATVAGSALVLVVDIGGGSTELTLGPGPHTALDAESATISLDIGCVRLSERFLRHDPPKDEELAAARAEVQEHVARARATLPAVLPGSLLLVGLAGTVSTLAALENRVAVYDRARIHHVVLERIAVHTWLERLAAEDAPTRLTHPGMEEGREDVIVGGVLILDVVMEEFAQARCLVSEDDILDGLVTSLLMKTDNP